MKREYTIHLYGDNDSIEIIDVNKLPRWSEDFIDDGKFYYYAPNLKDISIILECLVGQGVIWQLSRELSERTGFDLKKINSTLGSILRDYYRMSDEDAITKWEESKGYIEE